MTKLERVTLIGAVTGAHLATLSLSICTAEEHDAKVILAINRFDKIWAAMPNIEGEVIPVEIP